jgi:type VI secretion system protein ImpA
MTDPEGAAATADAGGSAVGSSGHAAGAGPAISGEIRSQDDVLKMLAKIRAYYAANEPSSPVPLLLQRVERLVGRDFLTLITNLTPGARSELEVLLGPQPDDETP